MMPPEPARPHILAQHYYQREREYAIACLKMAATCLNWALSDLRSAPVETAPLDGMVLDTRRELDSRIWELESELRHADVATAPAASGE